MNFKTIEYIRSLMFFMSLQVMFAGTTGKISGNVKSEANGEALIGANVMVEGTPYGAATDLKGNYFILQVPPGKLLSKICYDWLPNFNGR